LPIPQFAIESQVKFHNLDPATSIIELNPRPNEYHLRTEDILAAIEKDGDEIALVLFSGIQYYTGQFFELEKIATAAHAKGCVVGYDLAHAVGNVPLKLHEWGVDFACWCTYKYLNSGPGGIGGAFVHEKHAGKDLTRFTGWWGTDPSTKFEMDNKFRPIPSAASFRVSNPSVLTTVALHGSLEPFRHATPPALRAKSLLLTAYLEKLLAPLSGFTILTPTDPAQRGAQLSLLFHGDGVMMKVFHSIAAQGIVCDERKPDVIRLAPAPLYNTFADVWRAVEALAAALK
ncbi:pyridoxal phosphate-dependent transferase, partial [Blyttiomyces helicus]